MDTDNGQNNIDIFVATKLIRSDRVTQSFYLSFVGFSDWKISLSNNASMIALVLFYLPDVRIVI